MITALREAIPPRDLLVNLTLRELRGKYKRSALGWAWSLINPLAAIGIYSLVFGVFLKVEAPVGSPSGLHAFVLFLLCGLLPWTFLANGLTSGLGSVVTNANLVKKVWFPRETLVIATVASWMISCAIELSVASVILLLAGSSVLAWVPVVALVLVFQTIFIVGLALALSASNVYFRDIGHITAIFMQLWFYLTPIVYPSSRVPESKEVFGVSVPVRAILRFNPMVHFIDAYRACLYDNRWPSAQSFAVIVLCAVGSLAIGIALFRRLSANFAEEL